MLGGRDMELAIAVDFALICLVIGSILRLDLRSYTDTELTIWGLLVISVVCSTAVGALTFYLLAVAPWPY